MSDYTLDELKEQIPMEHVLDELGARIQNAGWDRNEVPFYCVFHLNVNTPAASFNPLKNVFHCYSCGAGGSIIDAAMLHLETQSVKEAADWLEETFLLD